MNPIRYILVITVISLSCRSGKEENDKAMEALQGIDSGFNNAKRRDSTFQGRIGALSVGKPFANDRYDSLELKYTGTDTYPLIWRLYHEVNGLYVYLADLRKQFFTFCGDQTGAKLPPASEMDETLTNHFFNTVPAAYLWYYVFKAKDALRDNTRSEEIKKEIRQVAPMSDGKSRGGGYPLQMWWKTYLKDVPPVRAPAFINGMEARVRTIEAKILFDYKKQ